MQSSLYRFKHHRLGLSDAQARRNAIASRLGYHICNVSEARDNEDNLRRVVLAPNQTVLHGLSQHGYRLIIEKHAAPEIRDPTSVPTSDDTVMDFFLTRVGLVKSKLVNLAGRTDRVGALAQSSLLFFPACAGMTERRRLVNTNGTKPSSPRRGCR